MANDIGRYGENPDLGFYWIREMVSMGNERLTLIAVDQVGEVTATDLHRADDEAAMTREEAIAHHLSGAIRQANTDLDRRRKELPEKPAEPEPVPMDSATARFFSDPEW